MCFKLIVELITDDLVPGTWSKQAFQEATNFGKINYVFPPLQKGSNVPDPSTWKLSENAAYVYYCANETVEGKDSLIGLRNAYEIFTFAICSCWGRLGSLIHYSAIQ